MGKDHATDGDLPASQQEQSSPTKPVRKQKKATRGKPARHATDTADKDEQKTVTVQGQRIRINRQTTIRQIKERIDISEDNLAYLRSGNELKALNDDDQPYEYVDDEDRLTFRSGAKKNPFGTPHD